VTGGELETGWEQMPACSRFWSQAPESNSEKTSLMIHGYWFPAGAFSTSRAMRPTTGRTWGMLVTVLVVSQRMWTDVQVYLVWN
jgi:hypothetical protein